MSLLSSEAPFSSFVLLCGECLLTGCSAYSVS